jgi:peptidoglycan hydrolase-like protein with peptidoglycan-binding domain
VTAVSLFALMAAAAVAAVLVLRPFAGEAVTRDQLSAEVTRRIVAHSVQLRGTVSTVAQVRVPAAEALAGDGTRVITALSVARGRTVAPGTVVLAISRRPVFALPGTASAQRDLRPGDSGADVSRLQQALRRIGLYRGGDPAGQFGTATKDAVRQLYVSAGYSVPTTGDADAQAAIDARAAVDAAERVVADTRLLPPGPTTDIAVANAEASLTRAEALAAAVEARSGPMMPAAEAVFLPTFPARTLTVTGKVGTPVTAPPVTLAYGTMTVGASVTPELAAAVRPGQAVTIVSNSSPAQAAGTIATVGRPVTDPATARTTVAVTVRPDRPLEDSWSGQKVLLDVATAGSTDPVLAVPLAALFTTPDGRVAVSRVDGTDTARAVEVRVGLTGGGYAAVEPVGGPLAEGDRVLLGP